jgi:hypothetical protein
MCPAEELVGDPALAAVIRTVLAVDLVAAVVADDTRAIVRAAASARWFIVSVKPVPKAAQAPQTCLRSAMGV